MTVFVDDMGLRARVGNLDCRWYHLFTDTAGPQASLDELHALAARIGMKRAWFQGEPGHLWPRQHYDITGCAACAGAGTSGCGQAARCKRAAAIAAGAVPVTWHTGGQMMLEAVRALREYAITSASALGHEINPAPLAMDCRQCCRVALRRDMLPGTATEEPCPPPRPWQEPPTAEELAVLVAHSPRGAPCVRNRRRGSGPPGTVYVGRPTKWGNPFVIGCDGTRDEVVRKYRQWITEGAGRGLLADLGELRGRDLGCWCAPEACHADVLLELANAEAAQPEEMAAR